MTPDVRVLRSARVSSVALDGGHLVYDGRELRLLAGSAAAVWERIDGVATAQQLADDLAGSVDGDPDVVRADVLSFLEKAAHSLVVDVLAPPDAPGYVRPDHVGFTRDGAVGLLVDTQDGRRLALTPTATRVWELVTALHHAPPVVAALREEFPDAPASMDDDVARLLDDLVAERFLVRRPQRPA